MIKCPECHSTNIIWDQKNGYIVCTNCGLVLDRIYINVTSRNSIESVGSGHRILISEVFNKKKRSNEYRRRTHRLRKITKLINEIKIKPYLTLDTDAVNEFLKGKRGHVKLFRYKTWSPESDMLLKKIVDKIINNDPILASRTERAKWAIAKILYQLSVKGKVDIKGIANDTKLSTTHIRRLTAVVRKRKESIILTKKILQ